MITVQRQRGRRRAAAVIAAIAAAAGLIAGLASPASAASTATVVGAAEGEHGSPHGTFPDGDGARAYPGGLFEIEIDGSVEGKAYCIDIATAGVSGEYTEGDWATSGIDNLDIVAAILENYYPNGDGPSGYTLTGTNAEKAMGTQAAIWHFTNEFTLTDGSPNSAAVVANYEAILAAVEAGAISGTGEPSVTLSITPPGSTSGEAGSVVGPYVVNTTASSVTVTPSEGVTIVDSEGEPFTGEIVDGTELWLTSAGEGDGTISATASATATVGRVFLAEGQQSLILAAPVTVQAEAEATVSFTPQSTTTSSSTTTTAPETTTTTVPTTPETSVPPTVPPTTVPITPDEGEGGGLPVTGAQSLILAAVALLLVGLGVGFRYMSKRAEGTS